jgi:hypothetical protein
VTTIDNPYWPLKPGTGFHYKGVRGTVPQRDDEVVTHRTKRILGIPSTVVKDVDHSESKTFSIGCGISGGYDGKSGKESSGQPGQDPTAEKLTSGGQWGIKASVNPSWSWTDTKKWNVKDVDLENQTSGNTAAWSLIYNNLPEFNSSY